MHNLAFLIIIPVVVLNLAGALVGGVWLIALGELPLVLYGIIGVVGLSLALPLLLAPTGLVQLAPSGRVWIVLSASASNLYVDALMLAWAGALLYTFFEVQQQTSPLPTLLWSYFVATTPWAWMARRDGGTASLASTLACQIGYIVAAACIWAGLPLMLGLSILAALILLTTLAVSWAMAVSLPRTTT